MEFAWRTAFFTEDGRPVAYYSQTIPIDSLPPHSCPTGTKRRFTARYELPFNIYRVAHSFEDAEGVTASSSWARASTLRFLGGSLALSDILLVTRTGGEECAVKRQGSRYFPNADGRCLPADKLRLYLEIYSLSLVEGSSSFEVAYSIRPKEREAGGFGGFVRRTAGVLGFRRSSEPVMLQSFQRSGVEKTAAEELAIDINALEPGDYILTATVLDHHSGERASQSKTFNKGAGKIDSGQ